MNQFYNFFKGYFASRNVLYLSALLCQNETALKGGAKDHNEILSSLIVLDVLLPRVGYSESKHFPKGPPEVFIAEGVEGGIHPRVEITQPNSRRVDSLNQTWRTFFILEIRFSCGFSNKREIFILYSILAVYTKNHKDGNQ